MYVNVVYYNNSGQIENTFYRSHIENSGSQNTDNHAKSNIKSQDGLYRILYKVTTNPLYVYINGVSN